MLVLGGMRIFAFFLLVLLNRLNTTESAVFLYCRFSLFLNNPFFSDYLEVATTVVVLRGVGKLHPVHR